MSYDSATDPVVDYLREVFKAGVNARCEPTLGAGFPAIRTTRNHALALESFASAELPQLGCYVDSQRTVVRGKRSRDEELVTLVLEYTAPVTPLSKLQTRWPLLRFVWRELARMLRTGKAQGVCWAEPIGLAWHDSDDDRVDFDFATDGESAYPHFRATVQLELRSPTDGSELLPYLTALGVDVHLMGTDLAPGDQPIVSVDALTDAGVEAVAADGDPFDDASADAEEEAP